MAAERDPVAEIIAACKGLRGEEHRVPHERLGTDLTGEGLRRKLDALASGSFPFLRGTFHLMAADLLQGRVPGAAPAAPEGLIGGDVHLENFGTYRGASGELCFDVNDFDEVGWGPLDLDLRRLCTSAMLLPGIDREARHVAARELAQAWAEAIDRLGGRFPIPSWSLDKAEGWLQQLLREKGRRTELDLVAKVAPEKGHRRFGEDGEPPKFAHAAGPWPQVVELALDEYYDHLKQLKADTRGRGWKLLDVAYRFKGNGSLGRLRFAALLGDDEERMLLELKEAAPSAIELARGTNTFLAQRARVQTAAIRRMQGDPWPRVAGTHLGKLPALGREIQPEEEKLRCARFAVAQDGSGHEQLIAYARQCGEVLGRLHCRVNAPAMLGAPWNALEAARSAVSFAESYAAVVEADWHAYVQARSRVAQELGV
ncbi:MAG: DUF2252 domain-containing protein [Deltaproteobacteria bacterium]|nr:MAG: DUF2252 domain-containing protein [Deltaproteobacteria bacterium]